MRNDKLQKFLDLKAQISKLEKEVEEIKQQIIEEGSHETSMFTVEVVSQEQFRVVSADQLCTVLDPVLVAQHNLIKTIHFNRVVVKRKNLAA